MTERSNPTAERLREQFPDAVIAVREMAGEQTVVVDRERIVEILRFLRDDEELQYNFLSDLTAVDFLGREPRFEVVYHLLSMPNRRRVRLKVLVEDGMSTPSVVSVFPGANFHEREVYDLFGIEFEGHPNLRRILLPEDWEGHPLRKDYPLGYEPVAFTHNQDRVYRNKPFAED
ncbi:MAG: NADH-quinone oxidoreductase subunit C [Chloroflexi bacterium]|nr:MAG: NADH-quinone oxidoreductase subunit C [Chloroflexota bacterium]